MSDINLKYEKLGGVLQDHQEKLQAVFSRMQEVQKEASSVLQWLESKEEVLKGMDASSSPTKTETVRAQAESNKVGTVFMWAASQTLREGTTILLFLPEPRDLKVRPGLLPRPWWAACLTFKWLMCLNSPREFFTYEIRNCYMSDSETKPDVFAEREKPCSEAWAHWEWGLIFCMMLQT